MFKFNYINSTTAWKVDGCTYLLFVGYIQCDLQCCIYSLLFSPSPVFGKGREQLCCVTRLYRLPYLVMNNYTAGLLYLKPEILKRCLPN
jgi:hypothetical protein